MGSHPFHPQELLAVGSCYYHVPITSYCHLAIVMLPPLSNSFLPPSSFHAPSSNMPYRQGVWLNLVCRLMLTDIALLQLVHDPSCYC